MSIAEVEKLALSLTEHQRAVLAASLLQSLPGPLSDADEGTAEALRRDEEMTDASQVISLEQLDSEIDLQRR